MTFPIKFEDLEHLLLKQNRQLKYFWGSMFAALALLSALGMGRQLYFVFSAGPVFKERALLEDVCREVVLEMGTKTYSQHLIHPELIKLIEKSEVKSWEGEILKLSQAGANACKVIIKTGRDLRTFNLQFQAAEDLPFYYRLIELNEIETKE